METFNAAKVKNELVEWIRDWFDKNGPGCNAVVGISGGKDSTIVAALCAEALGKDRVIGVLMPNGEQPDIDKSYEVINHLEIKSVEVNIYETYSSLRQDLRYAFSRSNDEELHSIYISNQAMINLPPRIRMAALYAVSQSVNGRVSNNSNFSERFVGYSTRWGDSVGDFAPLANLTATEVKQIGYELDLPVELIEKVPSDGLCGRTDEDNIGFTYEVLDKFIRTNVCDNYDVQKKIEQLHEKNQFKMEPVPAYEFPMEWDDVFGWTYK